MNHTFYFSDLSNPTRYHLAKKLEQHGFTYNKADNTSFNENNLSLNQACQHLEYKHLLDQLLKEFGVNFIPEGYSINDNNWSEVLTLITDKYYLHHDVLTEQIEDLAWILKPSMTNNGDHIKIFNCISQLWDHYAIGRRLGGPHILQKYIQNPHCLDKKKYTLRFYVIITNYNGAFLYQEGYFNKSHHIYTSNNFSIDSVHLTNEHLDGKLSNVQQNPTRHYPHYEKIFPEVIRISTEVLQAADKFHPSIRSPGDIQAFDIFGFDFLVDEQFKLWLLEINHAPHFPTELPHALDNVLFNDFWQNLCRDFVLPIAHKTQKAPEKACWKKIAAASKQSILKKLSLFFQCHHTS